MKTVYLVERVKLENLQKVVIDNLWRQNLQRKKNQTKTRPELYKLGTVQNLHKYIPTFKFNVYANFQPA